MPIASTVGRQTKRYEEENAGYWVVTARNRNGIPKELLFARPPTGIRHDAVVPYVACRPFRHSR
jgi:hypothetical protein